MMERLVDLRVDLTKVIGDKRWRETVWSTSKIRKDVAEVTACIGSPQWWEDLIALYHMLEPIMDMLRLVDSDTRLINKILHRYEVMIASCLSTCKDIDEDQQDAILEVFVRRRTMFQTPAHIAVMLLDPEFRDPTLCDDGEVQRALVEALVQFGYPEGSPQHREVRRVVDKFHTCEPPFDDVTVRRAMDSFDHPASFWSAKSGKFPHLDVFAGRILRIWATTSPCERAWSRWSFIHSKSRNMLEVARAEKLVRCHWNLRLLDRPALYDDGAGERPDIFEKAGGRGRAVAGGPTRGDVRAGSRTRRRRAGDFVRKARVRWDEGDFLFDSTSNDDDDFFTSGTPAADDNDGGDIGGSGDGGGDGGGCGCGGAGGFDDGGEGGVTLEAGEVARAVVGELMVKARKGEATVEAWKGEVMVEAVTVEVMVEAVTEEVMDPMVDGRLRHGGRRDDNIVSRVRSVHVATRTEAHVMQQDPVIVSEDDMGDHPTSLAREESGVVFTRPRSPEPTVDTAEETEFHRMPSTDVVTGAHGAPTTKVPPAGVGMEDGEAPPPPTTDAGLEDGEVTPTPACAHDGLGSVRYSREDVARALASGGYSTEDIHRTLAGYPDTLQQSAGLHCPPSSPPRTDKLLAMDSALAGLPEISLLISPSLPDMAPPKATQLDETHHDTGSDAVGGDTRLHSSEVRSSPASFHVGGPWAVDQGLAEEVARNRRGGPRVAAQRSLGESLEAAFADHVAPEGRGSQDFSDGGSLVPPRAAGQQAEPHPGPTVATEAQVLGVVRSGGGEGTGQDPAQPRSTADGQPVGGDSEHGGSSTTHPDAGGPVGAVAHGVGGGHAGDPLPHLPGICPPPPHPPVVDPAAHGLDGRSALPTMPFYNGASTDRGAGDMGHASACGPTDVPAGTRLIGHVDGSCHESMRAFEERHGRPIRPKTEDVHDTGMATARLSRARKKGTGTSIPFHRRRLPPIFRYKDQSRQMPAAADGQAGADGGDGVDRPGRGEKRRGGWSIIHDDSSTATEAGETTGADDPNDSDYVPRFRMANGDDDGGRRVRQRTGLGPQGQCTPSANVPLIDRWAQARSIVIL
ncbi:hypothetical protein CBR_g41169 [Chara braunii]|uniref:HAT C-terminal dimerisation domain-containing protein n=1 Tax=Chara braunii TaxID=69332 RepID=A0A388K2L0_CHABU|nr:hypothetical protein CBR_g41169 [Chara braunii]|eukprot:GBG64249.1 hypothetical protein CBR_g41169 [Chara braunii]